MKEYVALKYLLKKLVEHKNSVNQPRNFFVGALIMDKRGNPLSIGFNSYDKTHPYPKQLGKKLNLENKEYKIYLHAEISALLKCRADPHTMIIARIGESDTFTRLSMPCPICTEAIKQSSLKRVYYTNNYGELILMNIPARD